MQDCLVHGGQQQPFPYRQAQQVRIGDLLGAAEPLKERAAQGLPVRRDGYVAIAGMLR